MIDTTGAVTSTIHSTRAGVGSATPATTARTSTLCTPSDNPVNDNGDEHGTHTPASTRHSNTAPDASETNSTVASCEFTNDPGPDVITVSPATTTTTEPDARRPLSSVTVNTAVYEPGAAYVCDTDTPDPTEPSPKSQTYSTIEPSGSDDPDPSRATTNGPGPSDGDAETTATGEPELGDTTMETSTGSDQRTPSDTRYANESTPTYPASGVYLRLGALPDRDPCVGPRTTSKLSGKPSGLRPVSSMSVAISIAVTTDFASASGNSLIGVPPTSLNPKMNVFGVPVAGSWNGCPKE